MKNNLQQVLAAYGWQHLTPSPVQADVWQVGDYCLKRLRTSAERGEFLAQGMEQARRNGFTAGPLPVRLPDRRACWVDPKGGVWLAVEWLAGDRCYFQHPRHLGQAAEVLGQFHQAAQGLFCPGGRISYHHHPQRLRRQQQDLLLFRDLALQRDDSFSRCYLALFPQAYQRGQAALDLLARCDYSSLATAEMLAGRFCHGDVAGRNFICTPGKQVALIDFDRCRYDLAMSDLAHLLSRGLADACWQLEAAATILTAYCGARTLQPGELKIAAALTLYPQTYWRLGQRYFQRRGWEPERLAWRLQTMRRYEGEEQAAIERAVILCCQEGSI